MRKRSVALFVALVMASGVAFAAQRQGQGRMGKKGKPTVEQRVNRMKADLNLTDQQAAQVKELFQKQEQERQTWRSNNPNATTEEIRAHREQMYRQMNEGLKKILTPEQYKKHEQMMRRGMKRHPKGPPQN